MENLFKMFSDVKFLHYVLHFLDSNHNFLESESEQEKI